MIIGAYGVANVGLFELCQLMNDLKIRYAYYQDNKLITVREKVEQPAIPVILTSFNQFVNIHKRLRTKKPVIIFVLDNPVILSMTNVSMLKTEVVGLNRFSTSSISLEDIKEALIRATEQPLKGFIPFIKQTPMEEYVKSVSTRTVLDKLQTAFYRVSNYQERKDVQNKVMLYMTGRLSMRKLSSSLSRTERLREIRDLLVSSRFVDLREAISQVLAGENPSTISRRFKVEEFDINYIIKSAEKLG